MKSNVDLALPAVDIDHSSKATKDLFESTHGDTHAARQPIPNDLLTLFRGSRRRRKRLVIRLRTLPAVVEYLRTLRTGEVKFHLHIEVVLRPRAEKFAIMMCSPWSVYTACAAYSSRERSEASPRATRLKLAKTVADFRAHLAVSTMTSRAAWLATFDEFGRYYDPVSGYWESLFGLVRNRETGLWEPVERAEWYGYPAFDDLDRRSEGEKGEEGYEDPLQAPVYSDVPNDYQGPVAMEFSGSSHRYQIVFPSVIEANGAAHFAANHGLGGYHNVMLRPAPEVPPDYMHAKDWIFNKGRSERVIDDGVFPSAT